MEEEDVSSCIVLVADGVRVTDVSEEEAGNGSSPINREPNSFEVRSE
jgi:hypothetical protein